MKKSLFHGPLLAFIATFIIFSPNVMAEDIECELKKDNNKNLSADNANEFTKNFTWRFKHDGNQSQDQASQGKTGQEKTSQNTPSASTGI